ncbi:MAG: LD-carboxypeptidase [Cyanobacteria bacterium P01_E01_bin.45]
METSIPPLLKAGNRVCVVLPSGSGSPESLQAGIDVWRAWGYDVVPMLPQEPTKLDYLAGSDRERLACLQAAFEDPDCRAILCGRGGYGATRLLPKLDWHEFVRSPKWIVGFSDITALLWAAASRGIASIHGPIVAHMTLESEASRDRLHSYLTQGTMPPLSGQAWAPGRATGVLMPANLTVATALLGTPDWPSGDRPIVLVIEDINEQDYRIDRMLTQWRNSGALMSVVGVALGRFCWEDNWTDNTPYSAEMTLRDRLLDLGIPVVAGLEFGHGEGDNMALPVGVEAVLDGDRGTLSVRDA